MSTRVVEDPLTSSAGATGDGKCLGEDRNARAPRNKSESQQEGVSAGGHGGLEKHVDLRSRASWRGAMATMRRSREMNRNSGVANFVEVSLKIRDPRCEVVRFRSQYPCRPARWRPLVTAQLGILAPVSKNGVSGSVEWHHTPGMCVHSFEMKKRDRNRLHRAHIPQLASRRTGGHLSWHDGWPLRENTTP